ncbi:MAG: hypothetical protein RLZZ558_832 [Planctomycetota bacterium]|jgi:hypothetical protein
MRQRILACVLVALSPLSAWAQNGFGSAPAATPPSEPTPPPTRDQPVRPEPGSVPAAPEPAPAAPANLPSAQDIFRRSVQAIGGEEAFRKHTSMRIKGSLGAAAMNMNGRMEILALAPNRFLTTIDMGQMGTMQQGFDGTVGWMKNPMMGTQLLQGNTLEELRRQSDFYKELDPGKVWDKATTKGVSTFAGMPCYEIEVEGDMGRGSLFYGVDDGLARGMRLSMDSPMGKIPTETRMVEYRDFGGLKMAAKTEIAAMGAVQTMTVESVDFAPLEEKLFELPPDVQALVAGKSGPANGATPPPAKP